MHWLCRSTLSLGGTTLELAVRLGHYSPTTSKAHRLMNSHAPVVKMTIGSSHRVALIAGITGQDGAYLARFLLGKGYVVHGTSRDAALARLDGLIALGICDKVRLHSMSAADFQSVAQVIEGVAPHEIYNLSGQSSVSLSFTQPAETLNGIALGTLNMLEALRRLGGTARFLQCRFF
jgi:GDP-D-mannose dehydratase